MFPRPLQKLGGDSKTHCVHNKLSRWKEKLLSHAGKEILIKTVAQAVPTYTMSMFKFPNALFDEMTSMVQNLWWGQTHERIKMVWRSWDKMCLPKDEGGLGFWDLRAFNLALLAKQGWRLHNFTNTLVHRVFKAQYFPNGNSLYTELGHHPSYAWRSIMSTQSIVKKGWRR